MEFYTFDLNQRRYVMTLLFADDQVVIASDEDMLQLAVHKLNIVVQKYNMEISTEKTKVMALKGKIC